MSYSAFGGNTTTGGFFSEQNNLGSPSQKGNKEGRKRPQNVFPVVIAQINNNTAEDFAVFGINVQMVCIVAILRSRNIESTKVLYEIEDHTGTISAMMWLENDSSNTPNLPPVKEGSYVKVYGIIRTHNERKNIMVMKMLPVTNINEVTTHLIDVICARTEAKALASRTELPIAMKANNPGIQFADSMNFRNDDNATSNMGRTPFQEKIFRILQSCQDSIGMSDAQVLEKFPKTQHREVLEQLKFLGSEGHVYSTIDDFHFKATASF